MKKHTQREVVIALTPELFAYGNASYSRIVTEGIYARGGDELARIRRDKQVGGIDVVVVKLFFGIAALFINNNFGPDAFYIIKIGLAELPNSLKHSFLLW